MAKIRSIKPITTTDEKLAEVSRDAELLFVLCWMFLDDAGRMEYSPNRLKMQIFPAPRDAGLKIEPLVDELCDKGCLILYEVGGRRYLFAPNFLKHQRIHKPTPSILPEPPNVPHGTPGKKRGETIPPGNVGKKCEELEVELEVEMDSSLPPANSDVLVEQIFRNYPENNQRERGRVQQVPPVDSLAIIGAINRHGVNCVLEGTRCYAKAVSQWPPGERQKIFGCAKFFNQEMYLFGPVKWSRSDGKHQASKGAERNASNEQNIIASLQRRYGGQDAGASGEDDRLQRPEPSGNKPLAKAVGALPGRTD